MESGPPGVGGGVLLGTTPHRGTETQRVAEYSRDTRDGPALLPGTERNQLGEDFGTKMEGTPDRKMTASKRRERQRSKIKNTQEAAGS